MSPHQDDRLLHNLLAPVDRTSEQAAPTDHPDEETMALFVEGALADPDREPLVRHLADCVDCRQVVAQVILQASEDEVLEVSPRNRYRRVAVPMVLVLAASLLIAVAIWPVLRPPGPPDRLHEHVFVAAVAVAETIRATIPALDPEIKWPNDVLLGGRKTSGINFPAQLDGSRVVSAVLGIGVNVNTREEDFPAELRSIATSLRIASGTAQDRGAFAGELLQRLETGIDGLRREGFAHVLDCWRSYFRMAGATVRIGGPGVRREFEGKVGGVAEDGALLLEVVREGKRRSERVLAGDVTLLSSS